MTRGWEGVNGSLLKIFTKNMAHVPDTTQHAFFVTVKPTSDRLILGMVRNFSKYRGNELAKN